MHTDRIQLQPTDHAIINSRTGAVVDIASSWTTACSIANALIRDLGANYHVRPAEQADLAELYDFRLVARD